jgi:REP element-mobilizing transposase RayT
VGRIHPELVAGGIYHVTTRGNNKQAIFRDEFDYLACVRELAKVVARYAWLYHSSCLSRTTPTFS